MELLHKYTNGNTVVSIYDDGTKIRECPDGVVAKPIHPESMDIKISNRCGNVASDLCKYCHEMSHPKGAIADLDRLLDVLKLLPAGTECALGGGQAQSHPDLIPFVEALKNQGLIANMTINQKHFRKDKDIITKLVSEKLIRGIGVSYSDPQYLPDIEPIINRTNDMVFHVIMGVNSVEVINELRKFCNKNNKTCKVLVLGYKTYGFGKPYYDLNKESIEENKLQWYRRLALHFKEPDLVLSFDNLAIQQLNLRRFFTDKAWNKFYMGKEGTASCYLDAVKQEYAICSVDPNRVSWNDTDLFSFFQNVNYLSLKGEASKGA